MKDNSPNVLLPHYIIKLTDNNQDYYLEWCPVIDAPLTDGMTLEEFKEFYRNEFGDINTPALERRLARVEKTGTSSNHLASTVDSTIKNNRAGIDGQSLSKQEIIQRYCIDRAIGWPVLLKGKR